MTERKESKARNDGLTAGRRAEYFACMDNALYQVFGTKFILQMQLTGTGIVRCANPEAKVSKALSRAAYILEGSNRDDRRVAVGQYCADSEFSSSFRRCPECWTLTPRRTDNGPDYALCPNCLASIAARAVAKYTAQRPQYRKPVVFGQGPVPEIDYRPEGQQDPQRVSRFLERCRHGALAEKN